MSASEYDSDSSSGSSSSSESSQTRKYRGRSPVRDVLQQLLDSSSDDDCEPDGISDGRTGRVAAAHTEASVATAEPATEAQSYWARVHQNYAAGWDTGLPFLTGYEPEHVGSPSPMQAAVSEADIDMWCREVDTRSLAHLATQWMYAISKRPLAKSDWQAAVCTTYTQPFDCQVATGPFTVRIPSGARAALLEQLNRKVGRIHAAHRDPHRFTASSFVLSGEDFVAILLGAGIQAVTVATFGSKSSPRSLVQWMKATSFPVVNSRLSSIPALRDTMAVDIAVEHPPLKDDHYSLFCFELQNRLSGDVLPNTGATLRDSASGSPDDADAAGVWASQTIKLAASCGRSLALEMFPIFGPLGHFQYGGVNVLPPVPSLADFCDHAAPDLPGSTGASDAPSGSIPSGEGPCSPEAPARASSDSDSPSNHAPHCTSQTHNAPRPNSTAEEYIAKYKVYSRIRQLHTGAWLHTPEGRPKLPKSPKGMVSWFGRTEEMSWNLRLAEYRRKSCGYRIEVRVHVSVPQFSNEEELEAWTLALVQRYQHQCTLRAVEDFTNRFLVGTSHNVRLMTLLPPGGVVARFAGVVHAQLRRELYVASGKGKKWKTQFRSSSQLFPYLLSFQCVGVHVRKYFTQLKTFLLRGWFTKLVHRRIQEEVRADEGPVYHSHAVFRAALAQLMMFARGAFAAPVLVDGCFRVPTRASPEDAQQDLVLEALVCKVPLAVRQRAVPMTKQQQALAYPAVLPSDFIRACDLQALDCNLLLEKNDTLVTRLKQELRWKRSRKGCTWQLRDARGCLVTGSVRTLTEGVARVLTRFYSRVCATNPTADVTEEWNRYLNELAKAPKPDLVDTTTDNVADAVVSTEQVNSASKWTSCEVATFISSVRWVSVHEKQPQPGVTRLEWSCVPAGPKALQLKAVASAKAFTKEEVADIVLSACHAFGREWRDQVEMISGTVPRPSCAGPSAGADGSTQVDERPTTRSVRPLRKCKQSTQAVAKLSSAPKLQAEFKSPSENGAVALLLSRSAQQAKGLVSPAARLLTKPSSLKAPGVVRQLFGGCHDPVPAEPTVKGPQPPLPSTSNEHQCMAVTVPPPHLFPYEDGSPAASTKVCLECMLLHVAAPKSKPPFIDAGQAGDCASE